MEIPVTVAPMAAAPMAAAPVFAAPVAAVAVAPVAAAPVVAAPVVVAPAVVEPVVTVVVEPPVVVVAAANTAAESTAEPSAAEVSPRRATPPPLPSKRPLQLALTLTPPPAPSLAPAQAQAPSAPVPSAPSPAHAVVLDAMLSALGGVSSPRPGAVDTATPNSAVWVEEEDVLTEMWGGARVVEERTVIDAPVAARLNSPAPPESALDLPESSPAPSEVRTPFRVSTFPLTPQPEPEALAADVPLFDSPAEPEHRPSDVSELLSRMRRPVSVEGEVRRGLLGLSRLEELAEAART
ncbi:MAG TPA: hypothetical protein VLC09_20385, partial [Polyangiaceae bacterium]|nr:hypothetical protein [Polyangiaceae bacterium]